MSAKYQYERVFSGITIKYDPCDHCGGVPSGEQIEEVVSLTKADVEIQCRICGVKPKIMEMELYHAKATGMDRWGCQSMRTEPMLSLQVRTHAPTGLFQAGTVLDVHPHCLKNAMPHFKTGAKV
jgi:hypothetical protein